MLCVYVRQVVLATAVNSSAVTAMQLGPLVLAAASTTLSAFLLFVCILLVHGLVPKRIQLGFSLLELLFGVAFVVNCWLNGVEDT